MLSGFIQYCKSKSVNDELLTKSLHKALQSDDPNHVKRLLRLFQSNVITLKDLHRKTSPQKTTVLWGMSIPTETMGKWLEMLALGLENNDNIKGVHLENCDLKLHELHFFMHKAPGVTLTLDENCADKVKIDAILQPSAVLGPESITEKSPTSLRRR